MARRYKPCSDPDVRDALAGLGDAAPRAPAREWRADPAIAGRAGLYGWWVDAAGAAALSDGLQFTLAAGRIYVGQTGATKPQGRTSSATLADRIRRNHLGGNLRASTLRRTLAAALRGPLGLEVEAPRRLAPGFEEKLHAWMHAHLAIATHPVEDRDTLLDLETRVVAHLDPPLNLDGLPLVGARARLQALRHGFGRGSAG